MICNAHGEPASERHDTQEEAERVRRGWEAGHYYHVRPVRVVTEVLGSPPEEWFTYVSLPREAVP